MRGSGDFERRRSMNPANLHRTLIVANRTAQTPLLLEEVEWRARARPTAFTLLIPGTTRRPDWTLEEALKALRRAARRSSAVPTEQVRGFVGGSDVFEAIE